MVLLKLFGDKQAFHTENEFDVRDKFINPNLSQTSKIYCTLCDGVQDFVCANRFTTGILTNN
jgi:hypothetical protein